MGGSITSLLIIGSSIGVVTMPRVTATTLEKVNSAIDILMQSAKLNRNSASTVVYYSIATWKVKEYEWFPILSVQGTQSTGKSVTLRHINNLCKSPNWISGKGITPAALRDELAKAKLGTAVIEEADECQNLKKSESLIGARCSPHTSKISIKKESPEGWQQSEVETYGATALHRRQPFADPAVQSRAIVIATRFREGPYGSEYIHTDIKQAIIECSECVDTNSIPKVNRIIAGRVLDTWKPLLLVAETLGDTRWLEWAEKKIMHEIEELKDGQSYEPMHLILAKLIELLQDDNDSLNIKRLKVDLDIGEPLRRNTLPYITPWQVSRAIKDMGFEVQRSGGVNWVLPSEDAIINAAEQIGYEDKVIETLTKQVCKIPSEMPI